MLTRAQLKQIPEFKTDILVEKWYQPITEAFSKYDINTPERIAAFISQCSVESMGFTVFKENLNYSGVGLTQTFRKYFPTLESTVDYARNPEAIANKVYANRNGNGDENSGDGWAFRGRGLIQLTGRNNHTSYANYKELDLNIIATYLESPEGALDSANWFWQKNNLNLYADKGDIVTLTHRINGGENGLKERTAGYNKILRILSA